MRELLLGCGSRLIKLINDGNADFDDVTTLDINPDCKPDVLHDMTMLPLPFADNEFDEIHAYEVLEHTGSQGDYKFFFAQFSDFWRMLKPGGKLFVTTPKHNSVWAWGDPSHSRVIQKENLIFLHQPQYTAEVGVTPMTDFRYIYREDFDVVYLQENDDTFAFVLQAVKPSRISIGVS